MDGLKNINFLSSSVYRVEVLRALNTKPYTPRDLVTETNASRSTVGRILKEFETRGWIERSDAGYETTMLGALITEEFKPLLDTMNRVEVLEEAIQWLPVKQMSLDLYELGDGRLVYPSEKNLSAHIEHSHDLIRGSNHLLVMANAIIPRSLEVIRNHVVDGNLASKHVYGATVTETMLEHDQMSEWIQDIIKVGDPVYRHDNAVPYNLLILDGSVIFILCDGRNFPEALLETENEVVLAWAESTFDSYRSESRPLERKISA